MTKGQLLTKLHEALKVDDNGDPEAAHSMADEALLDFINDEDVSHLYAQISHFCA